MITDACAAAALLQRLGRLHGTSVPCSFARRLQDIESDTGYDTRWRVPEGALARVSQTTVYDTC